VDEDEAQARRLARKLFRFSTGGWKVQSELPNPVNFEAATASVREEDVAKEISCGVDPDRHFEAIQQWLDAGFDRIAVVALGDLDRFFELWEQELRPRLESLPAPARSMSS
jgi:alkanesulfonate monooxygenase SsuD/methylene tetrahydromethanopterin reductase-like flavin-dependent oxidoreductase (luciferase family)